jgi:hypothetical protein
MATAASTATGTDLRRAASAAPRAGTTKRLKLYGLTPPRDVPTIPTTAASPEANIQLYNPRRAGSRPNRIAPFSLTNEARVANPNRVARYVATTTAARTTTVASSQSRSTGNRRPNKSTTLLGRMPGARSVTLPNARTANACSISVSPTVATSIVTGGAVRNGRMTTR